MSAADQQISTTAVGPITGPASAGEVATERHQLPSATFANGPGREVAAPPAASYALPDSEDEGGGGAKRRLHKLTRKKKGKKVKKRKRWGRRRVWFIFSVALSILLWSSRCAGVISEAEQPSGPSLISCT